MGVAAAAASVDSGLLAACAAVLRFSARRAKRSRLELSVGGGTRGWAVVAVVVGAAVGKVIGGREKLEVLDEVTEASLSSLRIMQ